MNKKFLYYFIILIFIANTFIGCNKNVKVSSADNSIKMENDIKKSIQEFYKKNTEIDYSKYIDYNTLKILALEKYSEGYLVLCFYQPPSTALAQAPSLPLYYVIKNKYNKYKLKTFTCGDNSISMGFSVNKLIDNDNTIVFGDLKETTWVPSTDKRILTDYTKMVITFDNGSTFNKNIKDAKGYIIVSKGRSNIKDMKLYNSRNEIINSLYDISVNEEKFR